MSLTEGSYDALALLAVLNGNGVLDEQTFEVPRPVNLGHELRLRDLSTLGNKKSHDSFGYEVHDVCFHDAKVALNEVLHHFGFHNDAGRLLLGRCSHHEWYLLEKHCGKIRLVNFHHLGGLKIS